MVLLTKHVFLLIVAVALLSLVFGFNPVLAQGGASVCHQFVPEASNYSLVYILPIPAGSNYDLEPDPSVPYTTDNTASIGKFDRIAYCLQLDDDWIWVSMDAFTTVPAQVGVPVRSTGAIFHQKGVEHERVFQRLG